MLAFVQFQSSWQNRAPVIENAIYPTLHNGWVTLIVDRTRKNYCDVKPSRVIFQQFDFDGQSIPFIIPLTNAGFVWPYLGRQKFGLGLIREKDLSPGAWQIVTTQTENCNWLDWLAGGVQFNSKPVIIVIPSLPLTEGQVEP